MNQLAPVMNVCDALSEPTGLGTASVGRIGERLECWFVNLLDGKVDEKREARSTSEVIEALGHYTWRKQGPGVPSHGRKVEMAEGGAKAERARLKVTRHAKDVAIVRLLVTSILRENELEELAEALDCLVLSGSRRVLIDFGPVEKMSSQVVAHLAVVQRRCLESSDGRLAVCGLRPNLTRLFDITGLSKSIPTYADERAALEADWPQASGPVPLPVEILAALRARRAEAVESEGGDGMADEAQTLSSISVESSASEAARPEAWLIVLSGPRSVRGRAVRIGETPLVLGRDPTCAIRSDYPGLSRRHAQIERRGAHIVLRDLGSTNGTMVKHRLLKGKAVVLRDKARLAIGPLRFAVAIGHGPFAGKLADETIVEWLRDGEDDRGSDDAQKREEDTRFDIPRFGGEAAATFDTLRALVIESVLVATPRKARLDGEALIDDMRRDLHALTDSPWPPRVVLNLVGVDQMSTRAIGMLLAHALDLERRGGGMRLCQANPRVLAMLERVRLPQIVETYNHLDDAVLTRWG